MRWNYYKLRQLSLLQSAMDRYYKLRQTLQSAMNLLQIATGITKCDDYYKLRQYTEWGNPRAVGREKGRDERFQVQAKEPLGTDTHRTISKNLSGCWLLIGHKKCIIIVPNRRTVSPEFFS